MNSIQNDINEDINEILEANDNVYKLFTFGVRELSSLACLIESSEAFTYHCEERCAILVSPLVYKPPPTKNGGTSIGVHGVHLPTDCIYLVPEQLQWPLPVQNSQIIQLLKAASGPRLSRWWDLRSVQEKVHPMLSFRLENRCQPIVVCGSARNGSNRRSVNLHLQVCIYNAWCRHECQTSKIGAGTAPGC